MSTHPILTEGETSPEDNERIAKLLKTVTKEFTRNVRNNKLDEKPVGSPGAESAFAFLFGLAIGLIQSFCSL